jgi:hypothetical protein
MSELVGDGRTASMRGWFREREGMERAGSWRGSLRPAKRAGIESWGVGVSERLSSSASTSGTYERGRGKESEGAVR